MKLPERLYYPLDKAAKKLNCDVSDIIHFAANGYTKLCVKVHSSGPGFGNENDEWSSYLLVDYKVINNQISQDDVTFTKGDKGDDLAIYTHSFDYINSYVRILGYVDFWLDENLQVVDSSSVIHAVFGLLEVSERDLYIHEMNLIKNESIEVRSFALPTDNTNDELSGYFRNDGEFASSSQIISRDNDYLRSNGVENNLSHEGINITLDDLFITKDEVLRLKGEGILSHNDTSNIDKPESPKTGAKKAEIIPALISLLPDFKNVNIDAMAVSKIQNIIEGIAAKQGVELPETHIQTWQKYLGRGRSKK
ncbi:hypothetical protein [Buttiauxella massiliensis]|uniref:hypothetical protein n=1 Tax=Buttiauxella massiliensis TaxID=2831590 RepID=UPI00125F4008|nr:hypothetical protein [Buttiauxella massiliensis]